MKAHPTAAAAHAEALGNIEGMKSLADEIARKRVELSRLLCLGPVSPDDVILVQSEIADLTSRQSTIKVEVTPAVVSHHQQTVAEIAAKVAALQRHRAELSARLEADPVPSPSEHLKREREDILADLAMGEPREADLASIDARIRAAEDEAAPALAQAAAAAIADRQTLAGIDRRLIAADEDLRRLRRDTTVLLGHFVVNEMRDLATLYEDAAAQAAALLLRIAALGRIRQEKTHMVDAGIDLSRVHTACFPTPLGHQPAQTWGLIAGYSGEHIEAAIDAEAQRLISLGVVIP